MIPLLIIVHNAFGVQGTRRVQWTSGTRVRGNSWLVPALAFVMGGPRQRKDQAAGHVSLHGRWGTLTDECVLTRHTGPKDACFVDNEAMSLVELRQVVRSCGCAAWMVDWVCVPMSDREGEMLETLEQSAKSAQALRAFHVACAPTSARLAAIESAWAQLPACDSVTDKVRCAALDKVTRDVQATLQAGVLYTDTSNNPTPRACPLAAALTDTFQLYAQIPKLLGTEVEPKKKQGHDRGENETKCESASDHELRTHLETHFWTACAQWRALFTPLFERWNEAFQGVCDAWGWSAHGLYLKVTLEPRHQGVWPATLHQKQDMNTCGTLPSASALHAAMVLSLHHTFDLGAVALLPCLDSAASTSLTLL